MNIQNFCFHTDFICMDICFYHGLSLWVEMRVKFSNLICVTSAFMYFKSLCSYGFPLVKPVADIFFKFDDWEFWFLVVSESKITLQNLWTFAATISALFFHVVCKTLTLTNQVIKNVNLNYQLCLPLELTWKPKSRMCYSSNLVVLMHWFQFSYKIYRFSNFIKNTCKY